MRLLPKKRMQWREPKPFRAIAREYARTRRRAWREIAVYAIIVVMLMVQWLIARQKPGSQAAPFHIAVVLAGVLGVFLVYLVPRANLRMPAQIALFDRRIVRQGGQPESFPFKKIEAFSWCLASEYSVLVLHIRGGRAAPIGVPVEVDLTGVSDVLIAGGVVFEAEARLELVEVSGRHVLRDVTPATPGAGAPSA